MKTCYKCNLEKDVIHFNKNKSKSDGLDIYCKPCVIEKSRKYSPRKEKKQTVFENSRICLTCGAEKSNECFSKNKNTINGIYYYCKECVSSNNKTKDWYKQQYPRNKDYKINWENIKYSTDINHKLKSNLRCRMNSMLTKKNIHRDNSSLKYLGCSIEYYRSYIEQQFSEGMTWENHGNIWEIDHIIPLSKFDLSLEENIFKAFHYINTQPLYKSDNRSKKNNII